MKKKITSKQIESKLKKLKNINFDNCGCIVILLGTLLKKAKIITKDLKKKNLNSIKLHDLNVQSRTIREIIDDMLEELTKQTKRKQRKQHARVGRK